MSQKRMWIPFLKTDEGRELIWLDYCGYHLVDCQSKMTAVQSAVVAKGRLELYKEMNEVKEK